MKRVAVLGSTGSVGGATLDVVASHPSRFRAVALAAGRNLERLRHQIAVHRPALVSVAEPADAAALAREFPGLEVVAGPEGLERVAVAEDADIVVSALVGAAGLAPTVAAIRAGRDIALANKETLVAAGELVIAEAASSGIRLLPVDSEHSALHRVLDGTRLDDVARLILTASGGPFRTWPRERMASATVEQALAHPTWRMGRKISIDSATMVNKGLEIIEAHHLFGVPEDRIEVVIHPQSLIHCLVELCDGSLLAQLAANDMRLPIADALAWPDRLATGRDRLDPATLGTLELLPPEPDRFPALDLARDALRMGGEMPAVLNAANEVAVGAFLGERCSFDRITATIEAVMDDWTRRNRRLTSLEQVVAADAEARRMAALELGNTPAAPRVRSS